MLALPFGFRLERSGQCETMERAGKRLRIVVPITLAIIFGRPHFNFRSVIENAIVTLSLLFSRVGGSVIDVDSALQHERGPT